MVTYIAKIQGSCNILSDELKIERARNVYLFGTPIEFKGHYVELTPAMVYGEEEIDMTTITDNEFEIIKKMELVLGRWLARIPIQFS